MYKPDSYFINVILFLVMDGNVKTEGGGGGRVEGVVGRVRW